MELIKFFSVVISNLKCFDRENEKCLVQYYSDRKQVLYHNGLKKVIRCRKKSKKALEKKTIFMVVKNNYPSSNLKDNYFCIIGNNMKF